MSLPTRWSVVCAFFVVACLVLAFACATGGDISNRSGDDSGVTPIDAPMTMKMDGSTPPPSDAPKDASIPPPPQDAPPPPPPMDAPSGPFCMTNSQCTNVGECCLAINMVGFCAPGTIVFDVCLPIQP